MRVGLSAFLTRARALFIFIIVFWDSGYTEASTGIKHIKNSTLANDVVGSVLYARTGMDEALVTVTDKLTVKFTKKHVGISKA